MSGSVAQAFEHVDTASGTTSVVAATFTGNGIIACATNDASAASTISCADPTNGTYTPLDDILDTTDQQRFATFGKSGSTASGSVNVTFTWTVANVFKGGCVVDCTGVAGALDQHTGAYQHLPTTTANTQLSGTTGTLNTQPALVVGLGFASGGNAPPAQGTTGGTWSAPVSGAATFWSFGGGLTLRIEWQRVTSTAGVQAVFTSAANIDAITAVAVLDETGGGAPAAQVGTPSLPPFRMVGPGRFRATGPKLRTRASFTNDSGTFITGISATSSTGTVTPAIDVALTGSSASSSAGTLGVSTSVGLTAPQLSIAAGNVTSGSNVTASLTGNAATASAGTMAPSSTVALTGSSATSSPGTVTPVFPRTPTGISATSSGGTMAPSTSVGLTGSAMTISAGTLSVPITSLYPISLSGRKMFYRDGTPFRIKGRTAWAIMGLTPTLRDAFLDDCVAHGFNTIECEIPTRAPEMNLRPDDSAGNHPFLKTLGGATWNGSLSWSGNSNAPDFNTPNPLYWASVDALIQACYNRNIMVMPFFAYLGQGGGSTAEGWLDELNAIEAVSGTAGLQSYGAFVGDRFKAFPNIIYGTAGDTASGFDAEFYTTTGIQSVSGQASGPQFTSQRAGGQISTDGSGALGTSTTINGAYDWATAITQCQRGFSASSSIPAFLIEEPYDEEGTAGTGDNPTFSNTPPAMRRYEWRGWLNAIGGYVAGNGYVWRFALSGTPPLTDDYRNHLNTQNTQDLARLNAFMEFWPNTNDLIPGGLGGMRTLVVSGAGTIDTDNFNCAAQTSTGDLMIAYLSDGGASTIQLDLRSMAPGRLIKARFWDPTNNTWTTNGSAAGTFSISSTASAQSFTTPGSNSASEGDWLLVLESETLAGSQAPAPFNVVGPGRLRSPRGARATRSFASPAASNLTVGATGASATSSPGTVGVAMSVGATGASATSSSGTVAPAIAVGVTGSAATSTSGTPAPASSVGVTGSSAASAPGTATPVFSLGTTGAAAATAAGSAAPASSVGVTGSSAASAPGIATPVLSLGATGAAAATSVGSAAPSNSVGATGASATSAGGTTTPNITIALTGIAAASAAGNVSASGTGSATLAGASATSTSGTLGPQIAITVTGAAASSSTGTVSPSSAKAITGAAAASASGTPAPALAVGATGAVASAAVGSASPSSAIGATGASSVSGAGTPGPNITIALTGVAAATAAGNVSASAPGSAALAGASATSSGGSMTPQTTVGTTGAAATTTAGAATPVSAIPVTGSSSSAAAGTMAGVAAAIPLPGISATSTAGVAVPVFTTAITGRALSSASGTVTPVVGVTVTLTGVSASAVPGTMGVTMTSNVTLTGAGIHISAGTMLPNGFSPIPRQRIGFGRSKIIFKRRGAPRGL